MASIIEIDTQKGRDSNTNLLKLGFKSVLSYVSQDPDALITQDPMVARLIKGIFMVDEFHPRRFDWLRTLFSTINKGETYKFSHFYTVRESVSLFPLDFLNILFDESILNIETRNELLAYCDVEGTLLSQIDLEFLIEWCKEKNEVGIWKSIASGIQVLEKKVDNTYRLTTEAKEFLIASKKPTEILNCYAERIYKGELDWKTI